MAPSILSDHAEAAIFKAVKNGITTHIKSNIEAAKNGVTATTTELNQPEDIVQEFHASGELNGFHTPETPESMESDDPVVIVGMGALAFEFHPHPLRD